MSIGKIGIELEGFVYARERQERVDVYSYFGGEELLVSGAGRISTDAYRHQLELALDPCERVGDICEKIHMLLSRLPPDWTLFWTGKDPYALQTPLPWAPKPRYSAIHESVRKEMHGDPRWEKILMNGWYCALHIHFEVNPASHEGVTALNYLNNIGPYYAHMHNNEKTSRLKNGWYGWGNHLRLPAPRWFQDAEEMSIAWKKPPLLIKQGSDLRWKPDLCSVPQEGDVYAEGTTWWGCRPRWSLGTIEFRYLPSMPPDHIPAVVETLYGKTLRAIDGDLCDLLTTEEWWGYFLK